jgi:hypothetical protein
VPRIPDLELHALWRERVRRQTDSSLTVARFCARERLSVASFYTWKRRLRLIDLANRRPGLPALPAFLPVTVRIPEHAHGEPFAIEADFPNGVRLRIPTTNARLACRLVRLVARAQTDSGGSRC